ncbi:survival motor neuron protein isoform X2 [Drosophila navojoa]|uniref:survival motor neuron protein isoform X2 n=1 Tax=Drosophila navojoa TaxID=7232 RepID=UPI0008464C02|nr:survival motor neuron protein isoform X2 [Drosophila navojoa]
MSDEQLIWEDSLLIKAYDDSINLARETLARRIADSTNTREANGPEKKEAASTSDVDLEPQEDAEEQEPVFKVGDFARATYTDGLDYEGTVISINEIAGTCVLRYVGYENEQEVLLADLLPSWGNRARRDQILYSKRAEPEEAQPEQRAKASKKSGSKSKGSPGLVMPPMPLVPPMFSPSGGMNGEPEQDFVAMLTAWYMSGYYTGLYQGRKEINAKKKTPKK